MLATHTWESIVDCFDKSADNESAGYFAAGWADSENDHVVAAGTDDLRGVVGGGRDGEMAAGGGLWDEVSSDLPEVEGRSGARCLKSAGCPGVMG